MILIAPPVVRLLLTVTTPASVMSRLSALLALFLIENDVAPGWMRDAAVLNLMSASNVGVLVTEPRICNPTPVSPTVIWLLLPM